MDRKHSGRMGRVMAVVVAGVGWAMPWVGVGAVGGEVLSAEAVEFFESRVRPLLIEHCYGCHSAEAEKLRGDLRLDLKAGWERGGAGGRAVVVPGDVEGSSLIRAVRQVDGEVSMPPKKKLTDEEIGVLEAWVRMGAPDPRTGEVVGALEDPMEAARRHWAFQPVREPALPEVRDEGWVRTPVDRFVLAGLEARGMRPAAAADARTLIRRASYVLTGLPPTMEQVRAFEADPTPEAFGRVVDGLLASPRYGERWGRHWLDVARYADTKGYVFEEERRYAYAYTYRDYVIRAFNEDKPYDRFLVEQIAADRLVAEGGDRSALAAMGFLTLGRRFLNNPHDIIDDRIDVVTRGTMALTVVCARCHDHKYDPVPTADYYSLYGVFASSEEPGEKPLLGTIPDPDGYRAFLEELRKREGERDDFVAKKEVEHRQRLREAVGDYLLAAHEAAGMEDRGKREELARARQLSPGVVNRWVDALERWRREPEPLFGAWLAYAALPAEGFAEAARGVTEALVANEGGRHNGAVVRAFAYGVPASLAEVASRYNWVFAVGGDEVVRGFLHAEGTPIALEGRELHGLFNVPEGQRKRALQRAVEELQATHPGAPPRGMVMEDRATPVEPVVFKRGNPGNRGDKVPRQFLGVLAGGDRKPFAKGSGRLELAEAIASPSNPLTARVAVNRVWMHHFGAPLVGTPGDFGLRSDPPTHPELLDWLAARFMADGWSMKRLHRLIVMSAAWQQASEVDPAVVEADPENRWLGRQPRRRLDFEAMRDTLLAASGRLDLRMGGHGVEITTKDYAVRRTVYGFVERQNLPGLFRTFDFASPDTSSSQRFQTTVPQQALFLMNSPFAMDQARGLAGRPEFAAAEDDGARVKRLFELVLQREAEDEEVASALRFLEGAGGGGAGGGDGKLTAWERLAQVVMVSNEAMFLD
jgi:hypothetical protein